MPEGITEIYDILKGWMNPDALTMDSAEGVIVIIIGVVLAYKLTKNLKDFAGWCIGLLFMIQLGYVLGFTRLNEYFPFREIFTFDILAAPAQVFAGTKVSDWILHIDAFMHYIAKVFAETLMEAIPSLKRLFESVFTEIPWEP